MILRILSLGLIQNFNNLILIQRLGLFFREKHLSAVEVNLPDSFSINCCAEVLRPVNKAVMRLIQYFCILMVLRDVFASL
jgi:hypothetical protein